MIYVRTENNVKIAVYDLNPAAKQAVLLIHGWPLSERIFEYQKGVLVKAGYRVITMDLRGFGNSEVTEDGYEYDRMAADIFQVVKALKLMEFILVGFSMGGGIVIRYMSLYQGYGVKKLCLLGSAAPSFTKRSDFPYGVTIAYVDQLIASAQSDRPQLCEDFSKNFLNRNHSEAVKNWFKDIALSASGIATVQSAFALRDEDDRPNMNIIHVPTGIFHGRKDKIVPFELGQVQHQIIKDSVLFPFDDSGHGIFYDELDAFNQCFLNFIK
ncbi:MAG: alpha/beta fold hydrolase [Lachnospiraceae bacterium]